MLPEQTSERTVGKDHQKKWTDHLSGTSKVKVENIGHMLDLPCRYEGVGKFAT